MLKLMLNLQKPNNFAFFCPVSRLHLTVSSPVGYTDEVTPAILKAVKSETVIDIDGKIDIETGTVKDAAPEAPAQVKSEEPVTPPVQEKQEELKAPEVPEQPVKSTKRGRKNKDSVEE